MDATKPIYWRQGLFLQPQHFQLNDAYHQSQHLPVRTYGLKHFWGVGEISINEPGLGNKLVEIQSGEFLFPDGAYVTYPGNASIQARSFEHDWVESEKPFTVYLGLMRWSEESENVTSVADLEETFAAPTRFVSGVNPEVLPDKLTAGPDAQVNRLSFALKIFWETELEKLANYHLIPIAQLKREGDDVTLSRDFIPPCLCIRSNWKLETTIKEIRDLVASRCRQLEQYKSPHDLQGAELEIRYLVFLLALRTLNRYVPMLYHLNESKHAHPWELYGAIRQLLGELSTFSDRVNSMGEARDGVRLLPKYDHENLNMCFGTAKRLLTELLESIVLGPEFLLRLDYDGEYYSAEAQDAHFGPDKQYWLVLRTKLDMESLEEALRNVVKLSSAKNLTTLIARAIPGVPLEHAEEAPSGLPRSPNSHFFKIDRQSSQWQDVERSKNVSLYWDTAPEDLQAEIIILRK